MSDWLDAEQHVERAHELYEAGRWAEAENELREALARNPYQSEWHFNLGLTLEAAARYTEAARAFCDSFELAPEDPQAALMAGISLLRADEPESSLKWFEHAERLDASQAPSFVHRIEAYARLGRHEQAEVMFYMAQQLEPDNAEAYAALADSLLDRNLQDKAVWCLREAARLDPMLPGVQSRLAQAYAQTGRHERARQLFLRELRQNPGDLDTLLDLGCLLADMNRHTEAAEKFRRVLELEPDNADAHFYLADLADHQGATEDALVHLGVVLRLEPEYPGARRRLASIKLSDKDPAALKEARTLLRRDLTEIRREPTAFEPVDLLELGGLLLDANLPLEAASVLRQLLSRRPNDVRGRHLLSVAYFEMGRRDLGMREARRVLRLDPRYVASIHNLALAHFDEGQWLRARSLVRRARLIDPDDASLRRLHVQLAIHATRRTIVSTWRWLVRRRDHWISVAD